jgi:hypothetical protein
LLLLLCYYIYIYNWRPGGTTFGFGPGWQLSEALVAFVPLVSIEDRLLLWMVVRSQTYYPKHILAYESRKTYYSLVIGSGFSRPTFKGGFWVEV